MYIFDICIIAVTIVYISTVTVVISVLNLHLRM